MNLKPWVSKGDLQRIQVTDKSLSDLSKLIDRDIKDAQVTSLSADRRFAIAYNAALNLASYVIRKNGYRVAAKVGHHRITFLVAGEILGRNAKTYVDYFDVCRRKRNKVDYDLSGVVADGEVTELLPRQPSFDAVGNSLRAKSSVS